MDAVKIALVIVLMVGKDCSIDKNRVCLFLEVLLVGGWPGSVANTVSCDFMSPTHKIAAQSQLSILQLKSKALIF